MFRVCKCKSVELHLFLIRSRRVQIYCCCPRRSWRTRGPSCIRGKATVLPSRVAFLSGTRHSSHFMASLWDKKNSPVPSVCGHGQEVRKWRQSEGLSSVLCLLKTKPHETWLKPKLEILFLGHVSVKKKLNFRFHWNTFFEMVLSYKRLHFFWLGLNFLIFLLLHVRGDL